MKKSIIISMFVISTILLVSFASAEFWVCYNKGEKVDFCNDEADRTAPNDGYPVCMASYNEAKQCYNQGSWNTCLGMEDQECSSIGGNHSIDGEPPNLTIINPEQDGLYTSRSIQLELELDERASIYYYDNINGRGRWTRVCSKCWDYSRKRSFKEGFNNLTFKAVDLIGLESFYDITFFIDSKDPKIRATNPRRGFASGLFEVQFSEENPLTLTLHYGTSNPGQNSKELDIENECEINRDRYYCETDVDLEEYNGKEIEYWFEVEDIAGNIDDSKPIKLEVDTTDPILNNPDGFWEQEGGRLNKYIDFNFDITEENFDEISYIDNEDSKPRWRTLCTRLKDGKCETRKPFRRGHHVLDIEIIDEAGNKIIENIEFDVV